MKRIALLLLVMAALGGCTHWKTTGTPAPQVIPRARVTPVTAERVVLRDVQVTADSVVGWYPLPTGRRAWVTLHRDEVERFEERRMNPLPNALLGLVAAYWIFMLTQINRGV